MCLSRRHCNCILAWLCVVGCEANHLHQQTSLTAGTVTDNDKLASDFSHIGLGMKVPGKEVVEAVGVLSSNRSAMIAEGER